MVSLRNVVGSETVMIGQPRDMVIGQFEDLEHHNRHKVHAGLTWEVLEESDDARIIRVGKKTARLYWEGDALLLYVMAGQGKGSTIYHRFKAVSATETEVEMAFEVPLPALMFFLAPVIRWKVTSDIRRGLREDKKDLEENGYPR